jgi:uncharacterized HAD superfamily protein
MKNLNICIDIDGTITDPYFWLSIANKYLNKKVNVDVVTEYEIDKVMGITRKDDEVSLRENSREVIEALIKTNNIYFVTARDKDLEILTYAYLKKNNIPYDDVFVLGTHYKVDMAKQLKCDIFIEDSYTNALQLSENGFKVLLIDTNYNRKPLNDNITRVFSWDEINEIIEELLLQTRAM